MYRHLDTRTPNQPEQIKCDRCKEKTIIYINIERLDMLCPAKHKMIKGDLFEKNFCVACFYSIISDELKELKK